MASKVLNKPEDAVQEMMEGLVECMPGLNRIEGHNVLVCDDIEAVRARQVTIISGAVRQRGICSSGSHAPPRGRVQAEAAATSRPTGAG